MSSSTSSEAYEAHCATVGKWHKLQVDGLSAPYPTLFSVSVVMDADIKSGDVFCIGRQTFPVYTQSSTSDFFETVKAGSKVELSFDSMRSLVFVFSSTKKGGEGGVDDGGWNIFPGESAVSGSRNGLYVPEAVKPGFIEITRVIKQTGSPIRKLVNGSGVTFILLKNGEVWNCGQNSFGQLGRIIDGGAETTNKLAPITMLNSIKDVVHSHGSTLFLLKNGDVWSCGVNLYGELGRSTPSGSATKMNLGKIEAIDDANMIACGHQQTFIGIKNGELWSCGINLYGELGRSGGGGTASNPNLLKVTEVSNVQKVASGRSYSCFLLENGEVWNCGLNNKCQLGRPATYELGGPTNMGRLDGVPKCIDISCAAWHALFLTENWEAWSCGYNDRGQLGIGMSSTPMAVTKIDGLSSVKALVAQETQSAFLLESGEVWNCGGNGCGNLGRSTPSPLTDLGRVALPGKATHIAIGDAFSSFALEDGSVWNCGINNYGNLGREVSVGSHTNPNLGPMDMPDFFGTDAELRPAYPENTLIVIPGDESHDNDTVLYEDDFVREEIPIATVYQVRDGELVDLPFEWKNSN